MVLLLQSKGESREKANTLAEPRPRGAVMKSSRAGGTACATTTSPAFSKVAEVGQAVLACLARLRAILSPLSEHTLGARLQ
jgi:hypothetical protein